MKFPKNVPALCKRCCCGHGDADKLAEEMENGHDVVNTPSSVEVELPNLSSVASASSSGDGDEYRTSIGRHIFHQISTKSAAPEKPKVCWYSCFPFPPNIFFVNLECPIIDIHGLLLLSK